MADLKKSIKDEMNSTPSCIPAKWNRFTVADGDWMQAKTLDQLMNRDDFLADKIGEGNYVWKDALSSESATRYSYDQYLSASISSLSGEFYTFSADDYLPTVTSLSSLLNYEISRATQVENNLSGRISIEETARSAADAKLQKQIDVLQAATDVIAVFGTYPEFTAASAGAWQKQVTDNDFIKVLRDSAYNPTGDEDANTSDDDYYQVYYQWHSSDHDGWNGWSAIGSLDQYYSVSEIDEYKKQIDSNFDSLSSTVADNFLSANENAVSAGKNILIDYEQNKPKITIKTKEDVEFNNVSSKTVSSTNVTALTAQGNSAKFTHLSSTNLNNVAISNLFGSAYSGAEASAWIYANSAILDIQPGYGLATGINEEEHKVIGINQAHCAYNKYGLALGTYCSAYSISIGNASFAFGESCYITGGQGTFAAGSNVNITGKFSCGLGDTSNINGNYSYSIGEHNNLTSDRQYAFGQGLSGNSFMIGRYNEVEPNAQFVIGGGTTGAHEVTSHKNLFVIKNDVISARDFSAGDVSLSSLTNMSAFGNGITDTATYNLSAVKLSAGQGIGFKNDTNGVLSITAEGTTYQAGNYISTSNKTIAVTGDLITSANAGSAASAWINSKNSTIAFTTNFKGSNNVITGYGTSSFSAGESYIDGNYIHIDTSNNSINLASSISSTNISANSSFLTTVSGISAKFDNISGKNVTVDYITAINVNASNNLSGKNLTIDEYAKISDISSTNINALSLTTNTASGQSANFDNILGNNVSYTNISGDKLNVNTSAKIVGISATNVSSINITANSLSGNNTKFTDISATNITGVYLSSTNISAKNISGLDNITAYSGSFNYIRGETLQGVTSSIDVDELISAVSSITGESNIYVRKDELECEIGTDNSSTNHSFAQGSANRSNNVSLAQGDSNSAYSKSFAQGKSNSANENSFVQGISNTAYDDSFAQGYRNSANSRAFAQGGSNTAYYESFAQGQINRVSNYSIGQGQGNSATNCSIAQGIHNNASNTAQAFGDNLVIESAMAIGKFNKTSSDAVFVIGNGTADSARNDLMVVDNSAAITLINYNNYSNQVDKIIISTTGVSGMYDHTHGGFVSTGEYSSEWSNICNIENKYVPLSALKCDIGSNNSASNDELVFMQGMSNYAYGNSLTQGSNNSAINNSLAQGYRNLASSNSIAVGMNNSAYANSQSFGQEAYASAGGIAINPHYWGSASPTKAINNSFAMGKECVANDDSLAFGQNNTASYWSVAFGLGISANNNQYIYGIYPIVGSNTVFAIGNGTADNARSNYVSINKYGTLNLKNTVNNANKSVIINGHDKYIRSEENCRNIPFLLTSGYSLTTTITGSLLSTPEINTETLLLYGNDSDYLNMWVPTGTSGNKFKLMKVTSLGTYKISVGIQAGYDMIFKNFSSGTTLASRKKIQTDNTKTSWPTPQQGTNISTSAKSFYFPAEANTTCVQFTEIPGHDDIDVIVDSLGKHFIMIKNHSEV